MAFPKMCAAEGARNPRKPKRRTIHRLSQKDVLTADRGMICDGAGLWLRKTSKTSGSWCFRYQITINGKAHAHEMGLGSVHVVSLHEAREEALRLRKLLKAKRVDPLALKRADAAKAKIEAASSVSFEDFARAYVESHRAGWSSPKHAAQWSESLANYAYPIIGNIPVADIDTEAVKRVLLQPKDGTTLWAAKPETASRIRSRIEKVLGAATMANKRTGDNPARWDGHLEHVLVPRSKAEKGRKRHFPALPYAELPSLMEVLRKKDGVAARALEFTILTCSRLNEGHLATWEEIDLPNKTWTVPPHRIKTREEHRVPLSARAVEILEALRAGSEGEHVFPGRGSVPVSDKSIREVLTSIRPGFSIHGMRSCFADWSIEATEYPREVREMALAHKVGTEVEQSYRRTKLFNRRRAIMDDWSTFCSGETTATILQFAHTS